MSLRCSGCGHSPSRVEFATSSDCAACGLPIEPLPLPATRSQISIAQPAKQGGNQSASHTALLRAIRLALGDEPDLVLWPVQPGGVHDETGRPMRTGPRGMADLIGILAPRGQWFCLEAKTGRARPSEHQKRWGALVRKHGGFYGIVRSVQDAQACLAAARTGATHLTLCLE